MAGHGRPQTHPPGAARACAVALRWLVALAVAALCATPVNAEDSHVAHEIDLELRVAIGGGAPAQWQGSIHVTDGELSLVRVLGLEPDTPASARLVDGKLVLAQRTPRVYDGVDIAVRGRRQSRLIIELRSGEKPQHIEVPLSDLVAGYHSAPLDEQQNRLLVRRTPGDRLRLLLERDALVFDTGEVFRFSVQPHEAGLPTDTALRCRVRLRGTADNELWQHENDFRLDRSGQAPLLGPFEIPLPEIEGVYRVTVEIVQPPRLGVALVRTRPLVERDIQLVAISMTPPEPDPTPMETVLEIDPAHPGWLDRLTRLAKLTSIPGFQSEPLGNGRARVVDRDQQQLVELATGGWQAYPLPLKNTRVPHILEVEYPGDVAQSLGISILEPNAAGQIMPLGVDSGIDAPRPASEKGMVKHRLVFWPRTRTPLVLLTNRHARNAAQFGKLRVLAGPATLPAPAIVESELQRGRLVAAYYDKPLFAENFNAPEALDGETRRTLDDWNTYYLGARRLIEELKYAGYNGAVISVACEGSTLYPSHLLLPTPKYDMGIFFASGQDPLRKDVLEMLFRLFDREGLQLVPAIQFSTPLVELEELRAHPAEAQGIELIGADGQAYLAARGSRRGLAPYYNPLDERVRLAMRRVVDEIAERYSHHDAFAGVSLQLSPDTFVQLPGEEWGFDDRTMQRFTRDTKTTVPTTGETRFAERARQLQSTDRDAWRAWRAKQLAALYAAIERDLIRRRGNARLYLAGGEMLRSEPLERLLHPTLPSGAGVQEGLAAIGLDPLLLRGESNIVLLRPHRTFAPGEHAARGSHWQVNRSTEFDALAAQLSTSGVHLFHEPATLRLAEFDAVSPLGPENTHTFLAAQLAPSGAHARAAFAQSLAAFDAQTIVHGGWLLPLGQEDALRDLLVAYRQLPSTSFQTIAPTAPSAQPIVCRTAVYEGKTYLYLVNPSPWPVTVRLTCSDARDVAWLPLGDRPLPPPVMKGDVATFTLSLLPYDLVAMKGSSAAVKVTGWEATPPASALEQLQRDVDTLRARAVSLRSVKPMATLANADFELPAQGAEIPGWIHAAGDDIAWKLDSSVARGKQSLHLHSKGPVAWTRSEPIPSPSTGRISVSVWLKVKDAASQPPLRLAIEARHRGKVYYRFASLGAGAAPLKSDWAPYLFHVDDLPTSDLTDLRIGFDLMGAGDVWIDDVQVFDLYFHDHEQDELLKLIAVADLHVGKGNLSEALRILDGYWPQFLREHVADPPPAQVAETPERSSPAANSPAASTSPPTSIRERVWNWVPKWR